jgi:hypothetical protein
MRRALILLAIALWTREARSQMTVTGSPSLTISAATAGSAPDAVSNTTSSYSVNAPPKNNTYSITAHINTAMPAGVTLDVTLASSGGGASAGQKSLSTTAQTVETGIALKVTGAQITYDLSATVAAGKVAVQTRTVTFTLVTVP